MSESWRAELEERVARVLAECNGVKPDDIIRGAPLWKRYLPDARAAIAVVRDGLPKGTSRQAKLSRYKFTRGISC